MRRHGGNAAEARRGSASGHGDRTWTCVVEVDGYGRRADDRVGGGTPCRTRHSGGRAPHRSEPGEPAVELRAQFA
ncbi:MULTISPECIES: hypothetical protein [Actinoalloteichus]|uniref:Uncharacterized protein n=1 Tax=Actinoalloteichus fjordicus TaxID=1612552 RepID=A0AAC9LI57_9PSEU|nr:MULTISPECIES: hypothetical protein [Actinoalloteichus]APU16810.1 hypothetical protein UA74_23960 [Actinoalloteichus fjordicus]APU22875.1 hypothetical protein UA75_24465 [Actinoalloteichus sp. GBA129-24]